MNSLIVSLITLYSLKKMLIIKPEAQQQVNPTSITELKGIH